MSRWLKVVFGVGALAAGALIAGIALRPRRMTYPEAHTLILPLIDDVQRDVTLVGGVNFRDIGGYLTRDGRCVRMGRIYRAGSLAGLTAGDLERLAALNLKLVCDLRSSEEAYDEQDILPQGVTYLHLPIGAEGASLRRLRALLLDRRQMTPLMLNSYTSAMIDGHAHVIGETLRRMADEANLPMVVHCTAGKDRTGVVIALLLALLGVPDETILVDYSQSNRFYAAFRRYGENAMQRFRVLGLTADDIFPLLVADTAILSATMAYVRDHYGSVEAYLRDKAGVDQATQARLKDLLVE